MQSINVDLLSLCTDGPCRLHWHFLWFRVPRESKGDNSLDTQSSQVYKVSSIQAESNTCYCWRRVWVDLSQQLWCLQNNDFFFAHWREEQQFCKRHILLELGFWNLDLWLQSFTLGTYTFSHLVNRLWSCYNYLNLEHDQDVTGTMARVFWLLVFLVVVVIVLFCFLKCVSNNSFKKATFSTSLWGQIELLSSNQVAPIHSVSMASIVLRV